MIFTWFAAVLRLRGRPACGCESRWIVRLLAAPDFFGSYQAIGLLATGHRPLRALPGDGGDPRPHRPHRVQLPGDDRRRGDERGPQPGAGAVAGIVGAGLALVASYVVVLVLMYVFTQRLFPVPYEWGRLALVVLVGGGAGRRRRGAAADRRASPASRAAPCSGSPIRWPCSRSGSSRRRSARGLAAMLRPSAIAARARSLRAEPAPAAPRPAQARARLGPEVYEAVARDEDRPGDLTGRSPRSRMRRPRA